MCGNDCYLVRTNKDKVYIAGAIEGHDLNERKKAFSDAAMKLQKQGYETYNPFDNGLPDDAPRAEHIRADLKMMLQCDYIIFFAVMSIRVEPAAREMWPSNAE